MVQYLRLSYFGKQLLSCFCQINLIDVDVVCALELALVSASFQSLNLAWYRCTKNFTIIGLMPDFLYSLGAITMLGLAIWGPHF